MDGRCRKMLLTDRYRGDTITINEKESIRCPYCNRLIAVGEITSGTALEVKCPKGTCRSTFRVEKL